MGDIPLGQIVANLIDGNLYVVPADGLTDIIYTDCAFVNMPSTGGYAVIGGGADPCVIIAVQPSTWGSVKALYR